MKIFLYQCGINSIPAILIVSAWGFFTNQSFGTIVLQLLFWIVISNIAVILFGVAREAWDDFLSRSREKIKK